MADAIENSKGVADKNVFLNTCGNCGEQDDAVVIKCSNCTVKMHSKCATVNNVLDKESWMCEVCTNMKSKNDKPVLRSPFRSSCGLCDEADDMEMVQCDDCDEWYHYLCVGVNHSIAQVSWSCHDCLHSEGHPRRRASTRVNLPNLNDKGKLTDDVISIANSSTKTGAQSIRSNSSAAKLKLKLLQEQEALMQEELRLKKDLMNEEIMRKREFMSKKHQLLEEILEDDAASKTSRNSSVRSSRRIQAWLQETTADKLRSTECNTADIVPSAETNSQTQSFSNQSKLTKSSQPNSTQTKSTTASNLDHAKWSATGTIPKVKSSLYNHGNKGGVKGTCSSQHSKQQMVLFNFNQKSLFESSRIGEPGYTNIQSNARNLNSFPEQASQVNPALHSSNHCFDTTNIATKFRNPTTRNHEKLNPNIVKCPPPMSAPRDSCYIQGNGTDSRRTEQLMQDNSARPCESITPQEVESEITARHFVARSATPRDLPTFTGNPDEWPLFICNYEQSTTTCGFNKSENLLRLQKALKGKAYESVKSMMSLPDLVPDIISTLRRLYGRPDIIVHVLLDKIRKQQPPKPDNLQMLITFALAVKNMCCTMQACQLSTYLNNPILLQELTEKLPVQERMRWAKHKVNLQDVNLKSFADWLDKEAEYASSIIAVSTWQSTNQTSFNGSATGKKNYVNIHTTDASSKQQTTKKKGCVVCSGACISVITCQSFQKMNYNNRWEAIKKHHLCRKCLLRHRRQKCESTVICGVDGCSYKHHRMLHKAPINNIEIRSDMLSSETNSHVCQFHQTSNQSTLFKIVPVIVYGNGSSVETFAFLDDGSSLTLMEESLMVELGLIGTAKPLCLKWTSNTHRIEQQSKTVSFQIGHNNSERKYHVSNAHTVSNLDLPIQTVSMHELVSKYPYLNGAPVVSYKKAIPRLLIGIDNVKLIVALKSRDGDSDGPVVSKTRLGWTVYGKCKLDGQPNLPSIHATFHNLHICECNGSDDKVLQNLVKEYFDVESFGIRNHDYNQETPDNKRAESILSRTTRRENDRFCTGLLWRYDNFRLPNSLPMAKQRLQCLKKRMERDQELSKSLNAQIEMYVEKGYARKLSSSELNDEYPRVWYLPMFPVRNPNKPNKIRMVWDAAAKVNSISLNSVLMKGPDMLCSLPGVLQRFRERRFALCGDIQEMYHQVKIRPEDQHAQRFLWPNSDSSKEPDTYVMQVMTFGASCSPSCAQYIKNQNAADFREKYPRAYIAITENHYVDDLLDSVDSEDEAIVLAEQIKFVHAKGGFNIRNWRSNSQLVLENMGENTSQMKNLSLNDEIAMGKVLGLWWNSVDDTFTYSLTFNKSNEEILSGKQRPTKRELLRTVASIFDPLGLLANYLVHAKIILQEVWRTGISWDEQVKDVQYEKWLNWLKLLPQVENVQIPRWYGCGNSVQLHVFVDASENAYGAVAYLRFDDNGEIRCTLVGGKTRVAPLKMQSIPRLELEACLLGARFAKTICEEHSLQVSRRWFWSDSKTALAWIKSDHRRYRQYVAFRVSEILDTSEIPEWHWVNSKMNAADQLTKWHKYTFDQTSSWFSGPSFLRAQENKWLSDNTIYETVEEIKANCLHMMEVDSPLIDSDRFSNWNKLVRTVAMVLRFINNSTSGNLKIIGGITSDEHKLAENVLYRQAQIEGFAEERAIIVRNMNLPASERIPLRNNSPISKLSPFIDDAKVLRLRSRIQQADVPLDMKQPVILPKNNHISLLIIHHYLI